jgi:hypothetical protein
MLQANEVQKCRSFDPFKLKTSKRRKVIQEEVRFTKTVMGVVPMMSFAPITYAPDARVLAKLRRILDTGLISQKQIAVENGLR